jgi:hypothetical protein
LCWRRWPLAWHGLHARLARGMLALAGMLRGLGGLGEKRGHRNVAGHAGGGAAVSLRTDAIRAGWAVGGRGGAACAGPVSIKGWVAAAGGFYCAGDGRHPVPSWRIRRAKGWCGAGWWRPCRRMGPGKLLVYTALTAKRLQRVR